MRYNSEIFGREDQNDRIYGYDFRSLEPGKPLARESEE